jgi:hypothetical protein
MLYRITHKFTETHFLLVYVCIDKKNIFAIYVCMHVCVDLLEIYVCTVCITLGQMYVCMYVCMQVHE